MQIEWPPKIELPKKIYELDGNGYLRDFSSWDEYFTVFCAKENNIRLTDKHWSVIYFLREYYDIYQIEPVKRVIKKEMKKKWKIHKTKDFEDVFLSLFPYKKWGIVPMDNSPIIKTKISEASRYAGLPCPTC